MSDLTERLLNYRIAKLIYERVGEREEWVSQVGCLNVADEILGMIGGDPRGDTLVRADDLRFLIEDAESDRFTVKQEYGLATDPITDRDRKREAVTVRLNNALGGVQ